MKKLEKTNNKINLLLYADLKIGMQVMDEDGDIGIIKECFDAHNILVEFQNGGTGFYCLAPNCEDGSENLYSCA